VAIKENPFDMTFDEVGEKEVPLNSKDLQIENLRIYIHKILFEAMINPSSVSSKFAIWTTFYGEGMEIPESTEIDFVLYDAQLAKQILETDARFIEKDIDADTDLESELFEASSDLISSAITETTKAVMRIRTPGRYGNCNGAWEVIRSAADDGLGPTLYDMIMSIAPEGLTSDRSSVSSSARHVWNKYATARNDIDKRYLDDEDIQITEFEDDDCLLQGQRASDGIKNAMKQLFMDWFINNYQEWHEFGKVMDNGEWETLDPDEILNDLEGYMADNEEEIEEDYGEPYEDIIQTLREEWYDHKINSEADLYDDYPPSENVAADLNVSYNTDYADSDFYAMMDNHNEFLEYASELGLDPESFAEDYEGPHWAVRDFFQGRN
tara:strand:- start:47034 stop:48176 length:1143 start_codon:yes stop_codon:yes gene_type:complete